MISLLQWKIKEKEGVRGEGTRTSSLVETMGNIVTNL